MTIVAGLLALVAPIFLAVLLIRMAALSEVVRAAPTAARPGTRRWHPSAAWPCYTVIVPLYREAAVVPDLISALLALDYPQDRLQVLFAVEADDPATAEAISRAAPPPHMAVVTVPVGVPRTKPRALMHALLFARGEFVVVYDAEDLPEPDQLKKALDRFAEGDRRLGCVQAPLNIYNPRQGWLTRQFTLEYTALFDAILPALVALDWPVPLGGTSNHFPRRVLEAVGGWDPYNVTEDADLGIRLSRMGYRVDTLPSTTWEEAPPKFGIWFGQRVRWLKGWMQTYLVHSRAPGTLLKELGLRRVLGLHVMMGGIILSALVHPWVYVISIHDLATGGGLIYPPPEGWAGILWWLGLANLLAAYFVAMLLAGLTAARRGLGGLGLAVLTMPIYWLLISAAAYRALAQLVSAPHWWNKTEHSARKRAAPDHGPD